MEHDRPTVIAPKTYELRAEDKSEVLQFLAKRPLHTVYMASLIRDNGIVSEHNRGQFLAYRESAGKLQGVALIGHATLVEARNTLALNELAKSARNCEGASLMRGTPEEIAVFWKEYQPGGKPPRLICGELLLEKPTFDAHTYLEQKLRPATINELESIVAINANLFVEEAGRNPLKTNPDGFRARIARRIEQGRVWLRTRAGEVIFKVDILPILRKRFTSKAYLSFLKNVVKDSE